jgi:hypothetical protein
MEILVVSLFGKGCLLVLSLPCQFLTTQKMYFLPLKIKVKLPYSVFTFYVLDSIVKGV